jgi:hypothetical protein
MGCEDDNITYHDAWRVSLDHRKICYLYYYLGFEIDEDWYEKVHHKCIKLSGMYAK